MISASKATLSIYAREAWLFITHAKLMDIKTFSFTRILKVGVQRIKNTDGWIYITKQNESFCVSGHGQFATAIRGRSSQPEYVRLSPGAMPQSWKVK